MPNFAQLKPGKQRFSSAQTSRFQSPSQRSETTPQGVPSQIGSNSPREKYHPKARMFFPAEGLNVVVFLGGSLEIRSSTVL